MRTLSSADLKLPNGAKILAIDFFAGIVLADTNDSFGTDFVTWEFYRGDLRSTSSGHYYARDLIEAKKDFQRRVNRSPEYLRYSKSQWQVNRSPNDGGK